MIESIKNTLYPEMPRHIDRWEGTFYGPWWLGQSIDTMENWFTSIQVVMNFALQRGDYVRLHVIQEFEMADTGLGNVTLKIEPSNTGAIRLNQHIAPENYPWSGVYFCGIPVTFEAVPNPGYRFVGWKNMGNSQTSLSLYVENQTELTACFEKDSTYHPIVINEINYKSASDMDSEDWVELFNPSDYSADVSGWQLLDDDASHTPFTLPVNTTIPAWGYLVMVRDRQAFTNIHPVIESVFGEFDFGLSSDGERILLFDDDGSIVDSIVYEPDGEWPSAANGKGATLELVDATADNTLPENWKASTVTGGTPGGKNSVSTAITEDENMFPHQFILKQNYPNPFNPETKIEFNLPHSAKTQVSVFDISGRKVIDLVNDFLPAGSHAVNWDGKDKYDKLVASGVYFYRLHAGSKKQIRKMILVH